MARHHDWTPLGRTDDPVPGDADGVWDAKLSLDRTVAAIEDAVNGITKISTGDTTDIGDSEATRAWQDKADDIAEKLNKAKPRYEVAAKAMSDYHTALVEAQSLSLEALRDAEDAKSEQDKAREAHDAAEPDAPDLAQLALGVERADGAMGDAVAKLDRAIGIRDAAAEKAKNDIHNKIEDDDVKDSFWDNMSDFADILSWVSTALGVLALVVNVIPVIGQALSAILGIAALITGALALVLHLGAAIDNGEGWDAVIFDAIGVATFGIGRAFTAGAKGLSLASRTTAWGVTKGMGGQVASRLSSGAFAFASKGPMTVGAARNIRLAGPFAGGRLSAAFGGLRGELSGALQTIRSNGGLIANLRNTPANMGALFTNGVGGLGDNLRFLQGADDLTRALDDVGNLRAMQQGVNALENSTKFNAAIDMADQAAKFSNIANGSFLTGTGAMGLDAAGVDIPFIP
jgi:hypothetical protein